MSSGIYISKHFNDILKIIYSTKANSNKFMNFVYLPAYIACIVSAHKSDPAIAL